MLSSRLKQAIPSVQLHVHRAFLNLEPRFELTGEVQAQWQAALVQRQLTRVLVDQPVASVFSLVLSCANWSTACMATCRKASGAWRPACA